MTTISLAENVSRPELSFSGPVSFSQTFPFSAGEHLLMEFSEQQLANVQQAGVLTIKGRESEPAVCCIQNETYAMKRVIHTNQFYLIKDIEPYEENQYNVSIVSNTRSCLELSHTAPDLLQIRKILANSTFRGRVKRHDADALNEISDELEEEFVDPDRLFTRQELHGIIRASDFQIDCELDRMMVFEWRNKLRILDGTYQYNVLSNILSVIQENDLSLENVREIQILENLPEISPVGIHQTLRAVGTYNPDTLSFTLDPIRIALVQGTHLLETFKPFHPIAYAPFMQDWSKINPLADFKLIQPLVVTDGEIPNMRMFRVDILSLPNTTQKRIPFLLTVKKKWGESELRKCLVDLVSPQEKLDRYVSRFTLHTFTPNSEGDTNWYTSREG
ncbi:putative sister chromatid cohesion protein DCC1 [Blattamonas nauphoetae]|uniref:Sister chromatid cohesion protein DCC1 n=1 Tax=Blattamonas nauphoetae TaxID=2049346 RepID=A0ABQ9Y508_9EUKA|nr:putative sister chromatid cohesion protein DCC1 [Blattamonas nauphoetae]